MTYNRPVELIVANGRDFTIPAGLFTVLAIVSALLSPQPVLLTSCVVLISLLGWGAFTLKFSKVSGDKLTLVIFADGRVSLESGHKDKIEGFLDGQQWCTHRVAVLRVTEGDVTRRLTILAGGQDDTDDFRRLNMWLRQDFCVGTRVDQVSGTRPG